MNQVTESRAIEIIITTLGKILDESREIAAGLEEKGHRLQYPDDGELKCASSEDKQRKDGYIPQLMELTEDLDKVNIRNRKTLNHLNKIL